MKTKLAVAGFVALMMGALIPVFIPTSLKLVGPIVCPGGQAEAGTSSFSDYRGSGYTVYLECISSEGQRQEVDTFTAFLLMVVIFFLPALILVQLFAMWAM